MSDNDDDWCNKNVCMICLSRRQRNLILACEKKHRYCRNCLMRVFRKELVRKCPYCKQKIYIDFSIDFEIENLWLSMTDAEKRIHRLETEVERFKTK